MGHGFPHLWSENVALNGGDGFDYRIPRWLPVLLFPGVHDLYNPPLLSVGRSVSMWWESHSVD